MASFLNNTGDIILDAVLTDYGRQLLAKGDGSFNIVKFAFGDDEIDYSLYDSTQATPNQDTNILNTVVFEAFTNNVASMRSKLLTIPDNNLLFLPTLKLNTVNTLLVTGGDYYIIPVNTNSALKQTTNALTGTTAGQVIAGVIKSETFIIVDQGLDSSKTDPSKTLRSSPLYETEYNIKIDSRLGTIVGVGTPISIDDDLVATYKIVDSGAGFSQIPTTDSYPLSTPIQGTKGSRIRFNVAPTVTLENTDTYFTRLGSTQTGLNSSQSSVSFKIIRSSITVEGVTTGYSIDIPVVFAKKA